MLNQSLMTNRRCLTPLGAMEKLGRTAYGPTSVSAAVAYLNR